jgi:rhodanese-related sulfurtransferase
LGDLVEFIHYDGRRVAHLTDTVSIERRDDGYVVRDGLEEVAWPPLAVSLREREASEDGTSKVFRPPAFGITVLGASHGFDPAGKTTGFVLWINRRGIFVDPAEVVALRKDIGVKVVILDLRDERDFNLFHIGGSRRVALEELETPARLKSLLDQPPSTVTFLVGNGEVSALKAWKHLIAQGVPNLYVIDGGMNRWLERYPVDACVAERVGAADGRDGQAWRFLYATGSTQPAAWPEIETSRSFRSPCAVPEADVHPGAHQTARSWPAYAYTKRVKLKSKAAVKGGCG